MQLTKKIAIFGMLTSLVAGGLAVAFSASDSFHFAQASGCQHEGHHYSVKEATKTSTGIKEYWVCCKCHEHYFEQPSTGTWTDAGQANITIDANDDRYIPKTGTTDNNGIQLSADGKTVISYNPSMTASKDVVIPEGVTSLGTAFAGKTITSISIPSTVESIPADAFKGCTNLTTVTVAEGCTKIGDNAFENCSKLETVTIPDSIEEIGNASFKNCDALTQVNIPGNCETIGDSAFQNCDSLKTVTLSASCDTIGENAFADCKALSTVVIESSNVNIEGSAFYVSGTQNWSDLPSDLTIYVTFTKAEEEQMIKNGKLDSDWEKRYTSSPWGWGLIGKKTTNSEICYADQWHFDANGNPVKNS